VFWGMLGVTLFGLIFTPVFYVVVRGMAKRRTGDAPVAPPMSLPDAPPSAPQAAE